MEIQAKQLCYAEGIHSRLGKSNKLLELGKWPRMLFVFFVGGARKLWALPKSLLS